MSRNQIGKFIQQLRKEKGLTQKELGNLVNVSDKTISKWENSNSIPDTAMLPALCEALEVTVNELLYGEKLPPEDYSEKAEENIMNLLQEGQTNKKSEVWKIILGVILIVLVGFSNIKMVSAEVSWYLDIWSFLVISCIWVGIVLLSGKREKKAIVLLLQKTVIPVGLLVSLTSVVSVFGQLNDINVVGPNLGVAALSLLYSVIVYVVLCVLEQRLH